MSFNFITLEEMKRDSEAFTAVNNALSFVEKITPKITTENITFKGTQINVTYASNEVIFSSETSKDGAGNPMDIRLKILNLHTKEAVGFKIKDAGRQTQGRDALEIDMAIKWHELYDAIKAIAPPRILVKDYKSQNNFLLNLMAELEG